MQEQVSRYPSSVGYAAMAGLVALESGKLHLQVEPVSMATIGVCGTTLSRVSIDVVVVMSDGPGIEI